MGNDGIRESAYKSFGPNSYLHDITINKSCKYGEQKIDLKQKMREERDIINNAIAKAIRDGDINFDEILTLKVKNVDEQEINQILLGEVSDKVINVLKDSGMDEEQVKEHFLCKPYYQGCGRSYQKTDFRS